MTAMDLDPLLVALAVAVTAVLWVAALALHRVDARVAARGLRNGALVALALFVLSVVIVTLVFNGRGVFAQPLDLAGAFQLGVLVGAIVAIGYLWLGVVLIAIGLIAGSKPAWTTLGAWVAVPIIVVSLGFGYVSYRSVTTEGQRPQSNGTISIGIANGQREVVDTNGPASCTTDANGTTTIVAGTDEDPHLISGDGRVVSATVTLRPNGQGAGLDLQVAGLDTTAVVPTTEVASSPAAGQLLLSGPLGTGTLTWTCVAP
jgi:hypothetical protein